MEKQRAKEVKHPKSTSQVGCKCIMYFITGVVELQSFQLYNRAIVLPAAAGRVWAVALTDSDCQHHTRAKGK